MRPRSSSTSKAGTTPAAGTPPSLPLPTRVRAPTRRTRSPRQARTGDSEQWIGHGNPRDRLTRADNWSSLDGRRRFCAQRSAPISPENGVVTRNRSGSGRHSHTEGTNGRHWPLRGPGQWTLAYQQINTESQQVSVQTGAVQTASIARLSLTELPRFCSDARQISRRGEQLRSRGSGRYERSSVGSGVAPTSEAGRRLEAGDRA
jgi:hypothetical protein